MNTSKYFKTFVGHRGSFVPKDEISFEQTEALPTYYQGWFANDGTLKRFCKYAVTRRESRELALTTPIDTANTVYFEVRNHDEGPIDWKPIEYSKTKGLIEYYSAKLNDGTNGRAHRYERIVAFDEFYELPFRQPRYEDARAVLIATDRSIDPKLPALNAVNDATELAYALRESRLAEFGTITTLANRSKTNVFKAIADSVEAVNQDGLLFIYLAGYALPGGDDDFLISTIDTNLASSTETAISSKQLSNTLATCKGRVLLIVDVISFTGAPNDPSLRFFQTLESTDRISIIVSERPQEVPLRGLSQPLLQGLLGHADADFDGNVAIEEFCSYMRNYFSATYGQNFGTGIRSFFVSSPAFQFSQEAHE